MAEVKWIQIATDVFDNRKIKQIEVMPDGDAVIVIWFKLLCLAGKINDLGYVYFSDEIPFTEQLLATEFNKPIATVQMALNVFQQFGMIEIKDEIIKVSNWERYQNVDGMERIKKQNRERQQKFRDKKKALAIEEKQMAEENVTLHNVTVTEQIRIDKNKKDKNNTPLISPLGGEWDFSKKTNVENVMHLLNTGEYKQTDFFKAHMDLYESLKRWMAYKDMKKPKAKNHYTDVSAFMNMVVKAAKEYGDHAVIEAITESIAQNYQGVVWDWCEKYSKKSTHNDPMKGIV